MEEEFFQDLIEDSKVDNKIKTEEEKRAEELQRVKNKNAEEARKRREAEAKERNKNPTETPAKTEEPKKEEPPAAEKPVDKVNLLGEQLVEFKNQFPKVDLAELDKDASFKRFIEGKLLGKKTFSQLYVEFAEMKSEISGKPKDEVLTNYERKAQSSSGSSVPNGSSNPTDVYSEEELKKISQRLPLMSDKEAKQVLAKFEKSVNFYKKKGN